MKNKVLADSLKKKIRHINTSDPRCSCSVLRRSSQLDSEVDTVSTRKWATRAMKQSFQLTAVLFSTIVFHSALSFSHKSVLISKIKPRFNDYSTETSLFLSSVTAEDAREEPLITQQENTGDIIYMPPTEAVLFDDTEKSFVREFTPMQHVLRIIPLLTAGFYLVNPQPLDDLTSSLWSAIYNWDFAQNPLFEAEVATFGFLQAIVFYMNIHRVLGEEKTRETRFDGELPEDRNDFYIEGLIPIVAYLGSIWLYLQFHQKPPMPVEAPTFGVFAVETIFGVWLYDLCFFPLHYIMHKINSNQVRRFHAYHHRWSKEGSLTALETVQHSYVDGFLQVATNIAVQQ